MFFLEGNDLINGWTLLVKALQYLGVKASLEENRKLDETKSKINEEIYRGGLIKDQSFVEIMKNGGKKQDIV